MAKKKIEYDEMQKEGTESDTFKGFIAACDDAILLKRDIEAIEATLVTMRQHYSKLTRETIPDLMKQMGGMQSFALESGERVNLKSDIDFHIKDEDKPDALKWLKKEGHGDMIKADYKISFGKGQGKQDREFMKYLKDIGYSYARSAGVHYQTMKAFLRKRREEGANIPEKLFGVHDYSYVEIKLPNTES